MTNIEEIFLLSLSLSLDVNGPSDYSGINNYKWTLNKRERHKIN